MNPSLVTVLEAAIELAESLDDGDLERATGINLPTSAAIRPRLSCGREPTSVPSP